MVKSLYSAPEEFAVSPLLSLLPEKSKVSKLPQLNSSLYARYERVESQLKQSELAESEIKALQAEVVMLREVLQWLDKSPLSQ